MPITTKASGIPAGTILYVSTDSPRAGMLNCNGAAVSRTTYAALFAAIGTSYGSGDGSTTFNVPDLRGEFVRGWDNGRGVDSGRVFGTSQGHQMQQHNHGNGQANATGWYRPYDEGMGMGGPIANTGYAGGASNGSENRPRNVAMLACIKY